MTEPGPAPKLDVFLSYKREERDIAEGLAKYLLTRGYDVWWDAALLAGEDFAKIVHAELTTARAVVVLWSKQARNSHWVRAEAALALANGTLINAVIDGMAFEGIPPEFSNIQAVSLGKDSPEKFYAEIAAAIALKGTRPSQGTRSPEQADVQLVDKVKDTDFFRIIAASTDPGDFEEYLQRFGPTGQFAGLAGRRITALARTQARQRSLWVRLRENGAVLGAFLAGVAALVAVLGYFGLNPARPVTPIPDPAPVSVVTDVTQPVPAPVDPAVVTANPDLPDLFGDTRNSLDMLREALRLSFTAGLTRISDTGVAADPLPGSVKWAFKPGNMLGSSYDGVVAFDSGKEATVTIDESVLNPAGDVEVGLVVDTTDPGFTGLRSLTAVSADGVDMPGHAIAESTWFVLDSTSGRTDGHFETLAGATEIALALSFDNGDTGQLVVTKPGDDADLRSVLFRDRLKTGSGPSVGDYATSIFQTTTPQGQ